MIRAAEQRAGASADRSEIPHVAWEQIEAYLSHMAQQGCAAETIKSYRRNLTQFFHDMPPDKHLELSTVARWRDVLLARGYMPRTVNNRLSAANGFLGYLGLRVYQSPTQLKPNGNAAQPKLTRGEYLRLLTTAKALGREKAYLLVKIFAVTGLAVNELPGLTAASVKAGKIRIPGSQERQVVRIPPCLQGELLGFLAREGITAGPVFVTRKGTRLRRTAVAGMIQNLAQSAQVAPEKCNARCLRRLFAEEQEAIWSHLSLLAQQMYDQLLDEEQAAAGWDETVKP